MYPVAQIDPVWLELTGAATFLKGEFSVVNLIQRNTKLFSQIFVTKVLTEYVLNDFCKYINSLTRLRGRGCRIPIYLFDFI